MPANSEVLIPRQVLFGNPDKAEAKISPDGKQLSFLAPHDGVLNVWVAPTGEPGSARVVTSDKVRGIRRYMWAHTSQHILYMQDKAGDENWRIYSVDLSSNETKDLTPYDGVQARIQQISPRFADEILLAINNRNEALHDIHRVNIRTGSSTLVLENEGYLGFETDNDFNVRFASRFLPDGSSEWLKYVNGEFSAFEKIPAADTLTSAIVGFDKTGATAFMIDSRGRNTAACVAMDVATGTKKTLAEDPRADASRVLTHPTEHRVQAVAFTYEREDWKVIDDAVALDFAFLRTVCDGDFGVTSRSDDDRRWLVEYVIDNGPVRYYLYERETRTAKFLFTNRAALEGLPLARMHSIVIRSRDGLDLISYLTLPSGSDPDGDGRPSSPQPMVLLVHGGPWARDEWGYDPLHQWLANRGYAVLSVNFRGSTGLGKAFINAADRQWGRSMHDDLLDGVKWAIDSKIADPSRVAIMGGSYGGYATLWGMTNSPDVFACGVDIVGPSNLQTLISSIPPYWQPMIEMFAMRVGDPRSDDGQALLRERSPLTYVENIRKPLLIGQGANDPRVKQAESDQIVSAMQAKSIPVTYVLYPDEGHGFARPENSLSFWAVTEGFLARHLGGAVEAVGDDFSGASLEVKVGADQIPGLEAALAARKEG